MFAVMKKHTHIRTLDCRLSSVSFLLAEAQRHQCHHSEGQIPGYQQELDNCMVEVVTNLWLVISVASMYVRRCASVGISTIGYKSVACNITIDVPEFP